MPLTKSKHTKILVASHDRQQADFRRQTLERAGFGVVAVDTAEEVGNICVDDSIRLIMVGHSVPVSERRKILNMSRRRCPDTPVLQLYPDGKHELMSGEARAARFEESTSPQDFLSAVRYALETY